MSRLLPCPACSSSRMSEEENPAQGTGDHVCCLLLAAQMPRPWEQVKWRLSPDCLLRHQPVIITSSLQFISQPSTCSLGLLSRGNQNEVQFTERILLTRQPKVMSTNVEVTAVCWSREKWLIIGIWQGSGRIYTTEIDKGYKSGYKTGHQRVMLTVCILRHYVYLLAFENQHHRFMPFSL